MVDKFIYNRIKDWMINFNIDWSDSDSISKFMNEGLNKFGPVFKWCIEEGILDEI